MLVQVAKMSICRDAAPGPSREKPLGFGCRLVGVVRREGTGYLIRRHGAQRPQENGVSLVPVPPDARGRNLSVQPLMVK